MVHVWSPEMSMVVLLVQPLGRLLLNLSTFPELRRQSHWWDGSRGSKKSSLLTTHGAWRKVTSVMAVGNHLAPARGAYPRGLPPHRTSCGSLLKDFQAERLQYPGHWHLQLAVIYCIPSKEQTRGLSWWRARWVVNVCHLPRREDKSVTGTSGETGLGVPRYKDAERGTEGSALVIAWGQWSRCRVCRSFALSSLCSLEARLRTLPLCQVTSGTSSFLSWAHLRAWLGEGSVSLSLRRR